MAIDTTKIAKVKTAMDNRYENKQANKKTTISGSYTGDNDSYPTVLACINKFGELITSWSVEPSDTKYPSEKLVRTALKDKISKSDTVGLVKNDGTIDTTSYQEAGDYIETSNTSGLVKNDGTIDTNTYLTEHQSLTNYVQKSSTSGLIKNDGTIDTTEYLSEHQSLENYIAKSSTTGLVKNDGTIDTHTYLTQHQDISGKANSADLATVATSGSYNDLENIPSTFTPSAHEHSASEVKDSSAHSNLGTSANAAQSVINTAIDTKIGSLLSVELIEVVTNLPTASASTMNKLYLVAESSSATQDNYEIFVTVKTGSNYAWEKVDTARIDLSDYVKSENLANVATSGSYSDLTNKPRFSATVTSSTTGAYEIGKININGSDVSIYGKDTDTHITTNEIDAEINQALDDLAEAIYPTSS